MSFLCWVGCKTLSQSVLFDVSESLIEEIFILMLVCMPVKNQHIVFIRAFIRCIPCSGWNVFAFTVHILWLCITCDHSYSAHCFDAATAPVIAKRLLLGTQADMDNSRKQDQLNCS